MKFKLVSKKILAIVLSLSMLGSLAVVSTSAAGKDDGNVYVTTKDNVRYLGVDDTEWRIKFTAADGTGSEFYRYHDIRINEDDVFDVRDLVRLKKNIANKIESDVDCDGSTSATDLTICRLVLLDMPDIEI